MDCKKKEKIGEFKNTGRTWRPKGKPIEVNVYDFPSLGIGNAIPYGIYDIGRNMGFVNVGVTYETAEFAVQSLRGGVEDHRSRHVSGGIWLACVCRQRW